MPEPTRGKPFEIGLVMAGAISAGAYTAGVCDFLIQALDAWEAAKADPSARVPRHDVRIRALTGASAGAMTSAIAAVAFGAEVDPVNDPAKPPPPERNRFYDAWVRQVDISRLLDTRDIKDSKVVSLLDSTALFEIATAALNVPRRAVPRRYVDDPLPVMLTVANLRGVPYGFSLYGAASQRRYGMREHMDHMRFAVGTGGAAPAGEWLLTPTEAPAGKWPVLVQAALASGAFPVGLAPRRLTNERAAYAARHGRAPLWKEDGKPVEFLCVDGGLMDNEPLELARRQLAGTGQVNPRGGEEAHRAVVMIDPFPNEAAFDEDAKIEDGLISVVQQMFGALINQARFKPEELKLAEQEDVYSRFMVAPSRSGATDGPGGVPAMASAIMGGFGGFFHESFRRHDFQLGRRNCQAFLKWHFALPVTNHPVFGGQDRAVLEEWRVREADGSVMTFDSVSEGPVPFAPVIPLCGSAAQDVPSPAMPTGSAVDRKKLRELVSKRVKKVGTALIDGELSALVGGAFRSVIGTAWSWRYASKVTDMAMEKIEGELRRLP
jgi:predicted acylesterase/phospholipase RssA